MGELIGDVLVEAFELIAREDNDGDADRCEQDEQERVFDEGLAALALRGTD